MRKSRKEKGRELEEWVAQKLRDLGDKYARPTRGSGNGSEIGDDYSKWFFVECKNQNNKNIVMPMKVIEHLKNQIPINTDKECFWVFKNNEKKIFIIVEGDSFFRILKKVRDYNG